MSFYSLPRVKLYKKDDVTKLNNITSNYSRLFYKQKVNDVDVDLSSVIVDKTVRERQPLTEDVKIFLLGTSDYTKDIESDIDLYVTRSRHNEASFRCKLDPVESVWRTENLLALLLNDAPNSDTHNPVIGSLLREID